MKKVLSLFNCIINYQSLIVLLFVFSIALLVFSLFVNTSFATEKVASLEEIVVTATKVEEPKKDVSASVQIITQEDIKNSTAKNAGDLIAEAAIGHVHKYPGALTARISLRGLTTDLFNDLKSRVLILINGNRSGTVNLSKIPVDDIERIEIVKGPASVLYGSTAMGGVINIITKEGKEGFRASVGGEIGSWEYWKAMADLSGKKDSFDFFLSASRSTQGDYETKNHGKILNTAFKDKSVNARLGYKPFDNHHISLGLQHWKGWDIGSPGARYSPDPDNYSDKWRDGFDIGYKTADFDAKFYLIKDREESFGGMTSGIGNSDISLTKRDTKGASIQKIFHLADHRIIIGGQWDRVEIENTRNTGSPYYPRSKSDSYGIFTEGRLSLLDKKLLLSAGIRYDYFQNRILPTPGMTSLVPKKEELDHLTTRGGLVYKITDSLSLKGNIGTAFRTPTPEELAMDVISWGTRYLGNPDLKPEKSISYDAGIAYSKDALKGDLTFFHTDFKDKIIGYFNTALNAQTYKNIDGARLQGLELNLSYDIGFLLGHNISIEPFTNITYHTRYSSKDVIEIGKTGRTLLYTPKWTGALGLRAGKEKWDIRLIANYTGDEKVQDFSPPSSGKKVVDKGDFTVVNLKGSYKLIKNLEITASIENLFDRAYEYVLSYPMPRRTFIAGVKWIF